METPPQTDGDDGLLTRYLLGELADEERDRLQEAYFNDDALFARLLAAEDDLIDAYVRGALPAAERQRFEQRFGQTPDQLRRLDLARTLRRAADQHSARTVVAPPRNLRWWSRGAGGQGARPAWTRAGAVAAAVLLSTVVGVSWWVAREVTKRQGQVAGPQAHSTATLSRPAPTTVDGSTSVSKSPPEVAPPAGSARTTAAPLSQVVVASVALRAGMVRGGGIAPELALSPTTRWAELHLELEPEGQMPRHASYQVVIETAAGAEVTRQDGLKIEGTAVPSVIVRIPATLLNQRDHVVLLSGENADGTRPYLRGYSLRVTR